MFRRIAAIGSAAAVAMISFTAPATAGENQPAVSEDSPIVGKIVDTSVDPDGFLPAEVLPAQTRAPVCMLATTDNNLVTNWVDIYNDCGEEKRVKALIAFGPDSPCFHSFPGTSDRHNFPRTARFDGLVLC